MQNSFAPFIRLTLESFRAVYFAYKMLPHLTCTPHGEILIYFLQSNKCFSFAHGIVCELDKKKRKQGARDIYFMYEIENFDAIFLIEFHGRYA